MVTKWGASRPAGAMVAASMLLGAVANTSAGTLQDMVQNRLEAFAASEIVFQRGTSRVPFPPLAYVEVQAYGETELESPGGEPLPVDQTNVSQGALIPFIVGPRDAIVVGEWVSRSRFESGSPQHPSFDVTSVAVPMGWLRQTSPGWQAAAFVMPLGHKTTLPDASWSWETMGGVFARKLRSDHLWWAVGVFADVGPGDDLYLPYLGASWSINEAWTLSAVLPWPAVLWAPGDNTLFRLGASPSGTSWQLDRDDAELCVDLATVDLGLRAERRLRGSLWAGIEAGVGGFRALSLAGDDWQQPAADSDSAPYVSVSVNFRPSPPPR